MSSTIEELLQQCCYKKDFFELCDKEPDIMSDDGRSNAECRAWSKYQTIKERYKQTSRRR